LQWDASLLNKQPLIIIAAVMVTLIYYTVFGFAIVGTVLIWKISMRREEKQFLYSDFHISGGSCNHCFRWQALPRSND
jgi:hypothetical protein